MFKLEDLNLAQFIHTLVFNSIQIHRKSILLKSTTISFMRKIFMLDPRLSLMLTINLFNQLKVFWPGRIKNGVPHGLDLTASRDTLVLDGVEMPSIKSTSLKSNMMHMRMQRKKVQEKDSKVFHFGLSTEPL